MSTHMRAGGRWQATDRSSSRCRPQGAPPLPEGGTSSAGRDECRCPPQRTWRRRRNRSRRSTRARGALAGAQKTYPVRRTPPVTCSSLPAAGTRPLRARPGRGPMAGGRSRPAARRWRQASRETTGTRGGRRRSSRQGGATMCRHAAAAIPTTRVLTSRVSACRAGRRTCPPRSGPWGGGREAARVPAARRPRRAG